MRAQKLRIYLKDTCVPYRVSAPRPIPLRFQEPANAEIAKYIASGIIVPCDEPTEWCSPAFFVPKGDGKRVRLVTDYTKLNRFVVRPVHPFPSVADIIQSIPASAACFAKLDATHGYFQIPLDEEASKLTTFILPSGRYRYLRAPMGLSSSSDEWCRYSDRVVDGFPWCRYGHLRLQNWKIAFHKWCNVAKICTSRCQNRNSKWTCALTSQDASFRLPV